MFLNARRHQTRNWKQICDAVATVLEDRYNVITPLPIVQFSYLVEIWYADRVWASQRDKSANWKPEVELRIMSIISLR